MGYKKEIITVEAAKAAAADYEYALLYRISDILLCPASELTDVDWKECREARLFREDEEIHIFSQDGMRAVRIADDGPENILTREYRISNKAKSRLPAGMNILVTKEYLAADEDGQMSIVMSRLAGIRKEKDHA